MERIYNKLKRLRVEELRDECTNAGIEHSRFKSKDDFIRAFVKKKASSAKLTPKKRSMKFSSAKSDVSSVSKSSVQSKCIIEDMKEKDATKLNKFLDQ